MSSNLSTYYDDGFMVMFFKLLCFIRFIVKLKLYAKLTSTFI